MKQKNYIIEFLRFFFTIGVVIGHTWCVFYQGNNPSYTIHFHNACVDFFFIIAGFFMATHFSNNNMNEDSFLKYNISRIKRFYPLLIIGASERIIYDAFQGTFYSEAWGTLFFLGGINNFLVWNVVWYISALFWCGIIASALLCFKKKIAILVYFPLIAFFSLSIMNIWGNCNLGGIPLLNNWLSMGLIRGLCGLSFGIEAFYIYVFIKNNLYKFKDNAISFFSIITEIFFILLVSYLAVKQHTNNKEFLMYFMTAAFLVNLNIGKNYIFRIFNYKIWGYFGKISAMVYVTHFYLIILLHNFATIRLLPDVGVYFLCSICSIFLGIICFEIEKYFEKTLKRFVFK